jgi:hypothetical protein
MWWIACIDAVGLLAMGLAWRLIPRWVVFTDAFNRRRGIPSFLLSGGRAWIVLFRVCLVLVAVVLAIDLVRQATRSF